MANDYESPNDKLIMGPKDGAAIAKRFIKIENMSTGTLEGENVDEKLNKADPLLDFAEKFVTEEDSDTLNNESDGGIKASLLYIEIRETELAMHLEGSCFNKDIIKEITIYKARIVNKKFTPIKETKYENCRVNHIEISSSRNEAPGARSSITVKVWIRFLKRTSNLMPHKQTDELIGNIPTQINLTEGVLEPSGGGEGGGGGGGGEGGGGGGF